VPFHETGSHEQDVADFELGPLPGGHGLEVFLGYSMALNGRVDDALRFSPREIVQQDPTTDDAAVLRPFLDAIPQRRSRAHDVFELDSIVEQPRRLMRPMPQAIPLAATLRIHPNLVIVANPVRQAFDAMLRPNASRMRRLAIVERPVDGHADALLDLLLGSDSAFGR